MLFSSYVEITQGSLLSDLRFIARAVSSDETRYFMNFILIEPVDETPESKLRAVATDGRRLHMVEIDRAAEGLDLISGTWKVAQSTTKAVKLARVADADVPAPFPNYKKVIPSGDPRWTGEFNGFNIKRPNHYSGDLSKLLLGFPEPTGFNLRYLDDIGMARWAVEWYEKNRAVSFKSGNRHAVIMPLDLE